MATKKYSDNDIPDANADWGKDTADSLLRPYSGRAVQKFIKSLFSSVKGKLDDLTTPMEEAKFQEKVSSLSDGVYLTYEE